MHEMEDWFWDLWHIWSPDFLSDQGPCQFLTCLATAADREESKASKRNQRLCPAKTGSHLPRRSPGRAPKPITWIPDTMVNVPTFEIFFLTLILCALFSISEKNKGSAEIADSPADCLWKPLYFLLCLEMTPGFQNALRCFWWGSLTASFVSLRGLIHMPGFPTGFHTHIRTAVLQIILWEGW